MRYRQLDASGDMTFGQGSANFLINSPETVQQAIITGLRLFLGEWFLNTATGMPWLKQVIGFNTQAVYDNAIKSQILSTTGVTGISSYSSSLNTVTRLLTINAGVGTPYGPIVLAIPFALPLATGFGVGGYDTRGFGE